MDIKVTRVNGDDSMGYDVDVDGRNVATFLGPISEKYPHLFPESWDDAKRHADLFVAALRTATPEDGQHETES